VIVAVLALQLLAVTTDGAPAVLGEEPVLTIDPCVEVDEATVREVMGIELGDARGRDAMFPASVSVRCVGDGQEIRAEPWASSEPGGIRTVQLSPAADAAGPVARAARSRELALAIAEIIRRRGIPLAPPHETPTPAPLPVLAAPVVVVAPAQPSGGSPGRWQLGVSPTYDYFAGGQSLAGGDLFMAARLGRWLLAEVRAGGRIAAEQPLSNGYLSSRAATVGLAAGILFWPASRPLGAALMLRAQEYLVQFRADTSGDAGTRTALLGAFVLAAEPRVIVALTRRFALQATAAVGFPPRGIVVRTQGIQARSMSGLVLSASLAGVLTF
jgi:hypothetical protein